MQALVPKDIKKAVVSQHDSNDCGAACLVSVLRFYGKNENLEKVKSLSGTTKNGTTLLGLQEAFLGFDIKSNGYQAEITDLKSEKNPAILHVTIDNSYNHYIVCFGFKNGQFNIVDPLSGFTRLDSVELEKIWKSRKLLLIEEVSHTPEMKKPENFRWFLSIFRNHLDKLLSALLLGFLIALLNLSTAFFTETIVDRYISKDLLNDSIQIVVLWAALLLIGELLSYARTRIIIKQVFEFNIGLLGKYFSKVLSMNTSFFDSKEVGDLVSRMNDAEIVEETATEIVGQTLIDFLIVLIVSVYLFFTDTLLGLMVTGSIIIYVGIALRNNNTLVGLQRSLVLAHSKRESKFIDIFSNIEVIKSYNLEERFLGSLNDEYKSYEIEKLSLDNHVNRYNTSLSLTQLFILLASFLYVVLGVFNNQFEIGSLFATFILVSGFNASIKKIVILNVNLQGSLISIYRLRDFVYPNEGDQTETPNKLQKPLTRSTDLIVKATSFKYPGYPELINDVNFEAPKNKITCIYGSNGSGKSTFLKIIKRLYEPDSGEVIIDNFSHHHYSLKEWNELVTYVEQNPKILNGSILDNISIAKNVSEKELIRFISENNFSDFLEALPDGIYTHIGQGGVPLSGGQKQIVSILRGVQQKSKILLLDEPTSSIDDKNKANVINLLLKIRRKKTVIISSHDPEILKISDRIYSLKNEKMILVEQ